MNMNITSPTAAKIYAAWLRQGQSEAQRNYLGASVIGHECDMCLWLMFRNAVRESFDGRMYRLFDRGKREEAVFCDDLRRIGCEVKEFDSKGRQFSVSALGGHFGGHLDGVAKGLDEAPAKWHVVEFKTHSDSSFRKLCKEGVKKAKPMHYAQMQTYMGHTNLDCALYMAVNKDNDDLWCERVKFDKPAFDAIMERAKRIIDSSAPDRCASRRDDFRCKACPCASICWHDAKEFIDPLLPLSCKTCCHSTAVTDGEGAKWTCRLGRECSAAGCPSHLTLPAFVSGEVVEGDERGIVYSYADKGESHQVTIGPRGLSEADAQKVGPDSYGEVEAVLSRFPDAKITSAVTLRAKYASPSYSVYFSGSLAELKEWCSVNPIADFTKPVRTETHGGIKYYEYLPSTLVSIDGDAAEVKFENPPF